MEAMVTLSMKTLLRECSLRKHTAAEIEKIYGDLVYKNHIHEVFRYRRFGYDFSDYMTLYNDGSHILGYFRPSYYDFLYHVLHTLGIDTKSQKIEDNEELTRRMLEQVKKLEKIHESTEDKERRLKKEFPILYHDLTHGRGYLMEASEEEKKKLYACGLRNNIDHFIEAQSNMYKRFITRRDDYKKSVEKASYNGFIQDNFDLNKVAMYTIHEYLRLCEKTEKKEVIQKYLPIIKKYENSSYDKRVSLKSDGGRLINWSTLQVRIQNVEKKLKSLESMKSPLSVHWELLPRGYKEVRTGNESHATVTLMNQEVVQHLMEVGERKKMFYEEHPGMEEIVGLLEYKGYIAHIYKNGVILLDRKYQEDALSSAVGNAIYCIPARYFEELSGKNKTQLQNDERVSRIIHSRYWEDKALDVIQSEGSKENIEAAKTLILKLKEHK